MLFSLLQPFAYQNDGELESEFSLGERATLDWGLPNDTSTRLTVLS